MHSKTQNILQRLSKAHQGLRESLSCGPCCSKHLNTQFRPYKAVLMARLRLMTCTAMGQRFKVFAMLSPSPLAGSTWWSAVEFRRGWPAYGPLQISRYSAGNYQIPALRLHSRRECFRLEITRTLASASIGSKQLVNGNRNVFLFAYCLMITYSSTLRSASPYHPVV